MSTITTSHISTSTPHTTQTTTSASSTIAASSTPLANVAIYPGNGVYQYTGCYNETTAVEGTGGKRALSGGSMESLDTMTPIACLNFCNIDSYKYAGLEYTKECWCAQYISVFSTKLDESHCSLPCVGNTSEVCGGSLALSVYQRTTSSTSKSRASTWKMGPGKAVIVGLAIAALAMEML